MHSGVITILTTIDDTIAQFLGLSIAIAMMLLVHPIFALILFIWAISFISIAYYFFPTIQELSHVFSISRTKVFGSWVDSISNITNIRLFARNNYENNSIQESVKTAVKQDRAMQAMMIKMHVFWDLSIIVLIGANLSLLIYMYQKSQVSVGDFSFIISMSMSIFYNLWYLASQFVSFAEEVGKCKQALSLMQVPHEIEDQTNAKPLIVKEGTIEFHKLTFHYHEGASLFNNKNLLIPARKKVGLVGFSGSGKSTFVNLILRLFIVIAHRLSTLSEMDRILVFDKGSIIEDGSHEELIKANSHYANMWHMQAGGFLPEEEI